MKLKILLSAFLCYFIWGCQTIFWNLFGDFNDIFLLAMRILMSGFVTTLFLVVTKRGKQIIALLKNGKKMRFMVPAAVFICADWGLFIWAVTNGHAVDSSLGYYINPIVMFLFGLLLFREKANAFEILAVTIAAAGVGAFTIITGAFPVLSVVFAFVFPCYAISKKYADADPIVSIAVECILLAPFAIIYILLFGLGEGGLASVTLASVPLFICCGAVTALPMILYTVIVNELPMKVVGIMQYFCTTIGMLSGIILLHEEMTLAKWVMFAFIITGIVVFTIGDFRKAK